MTVLKKATAKLRRHGVELLEISRCGVGYWVSNPDYGDYQTAMRFHSTVDDAVQAAVNGERPSKVERIYYGHS